MGIKRGSWNDEIPKPSLVSIKRHGAKTVPVPPGGLSKSTNHINDRNQDAVSGAAMDSVSETRREHLVRGSASQTESDVSASPVLVNSNSFKRNAELKEQFIKTSSIYSNDGARFGNGGGDTIRQAPEVYSPLFQIANLQLPRDRITMNAWNRNFYDTHPLVHNCINLHATYPLGKINIKCKNREVQDFFDEMIVEMDLTNTLQAIALEFWKIGEVFPYAELDEEKGMWKNIIIQNPDYIHVKTSVLGGESVISMKPDAALQRLVQSSSPSDMKIRSQIDEQMLYHIKKGNNIPLDSFHVSHLKLLSSPYDIHGTSPIVSIYKDLMLYDKLRESKFAQADNLVNPITLIKVGGNNEGEYR